MTEDYLHYVWRQKQLEIQGLQTTSGHDLEVVFPGTQNFDSGPDFHLGIVLISGQKWVGNIEIHLKASDWFRHGHHHDPAYESVILHVVYEADQDVRLSNGEVIPTLELKGMLDEYPYWRYEQLVQNKGFIPCHTLWSSVAPVKRSHWIQRMGVERFQTWSERVGASVTPMDSPETWAYHWVARALGLTKNSEPMLELARRIPLSIAYRHADRQDQLLALYFGTAGWLQENPVDEYQQILKREFDHLRIKYSLTPMEPVQWKTFRLRPGSLPILRVVQLVTLVEGVGSWSVFFNERPDLDRIRVLFKRPMPSYFCDHHAFGKKSRVHRKAIGDQMITTIVVNGLVPMILFSSLRLGDHSLKEYAYELLEGMEPERNSITREFTILGNEPVNALESQGMIHLKKTYCDHRKCLFCAIGNAILKKP